MENQQIKKGQDPATTFEFKKIKTNRKFKKQKKPKTVSQYKQQPETVTITNLILCAFFFGRTWHSVVVSNSTARNFKLAQVFFSFKLREKALLK